MSVSSEQILITSGTTVKPELEQVDVRGPRFAAWVTTAVLLAVLAILSFSPALAGVVLTVQTVVFLVGAIVGPRRHPYGRIYSRFVQPRLGPVTEKEPAAPLRFAQGVGFVFAGVGLVALTFGAATVASVAVGFALFAAFLNAAFAICLGCLIYPFAARLVIRQPA
ncbi:MAG: DUF4395 domain-containing protein [Nocardiaceae bacterium]|nr:DUF4395 domain-containing protein [Nocardiaceae bacterium]